jgi:hypothetical protein
MRVVTYLSVLLTFVIAGMWESKSLILECKTSAGGRDFDRLGKGRLKLKPLSSSSISSHKA